MSHRLNVLYLTPPPESSEPWLGDVIAAVGPHHNLVLYDPKAPMVPQFEGIDAVLDHGGSMGCRPMADLCGSIKLWQVLGTGIDHFDLEYWRSKGIPVANCPGEFSGVPLAECALMFMLMLSRHWYETQEGLRRRLFFTPFGNELVDRSLTLVGFGASARQLARRARAFEMKISAIDVREISAQDQNDFGIHFAGKPADLDQLLPETDFLSLHLPLNAQTRHIIDGRRLRSMKSTAILINVARGALVDEDALLSALREGRLAAAGLDVFSQEPLDPAHPILQLPNVVATPHVSGATFGTSKRRAACGARNLDRIASGLEPLYRVDRPQGA